MSSLTSTIVPLATKQTSTRFHCWAQGRNRRDASSDHLRDESAYCTCFSVFTQAIIYHPRDPIEFPKLLGQGVVLSARSITIFPDYRQIQPAPSDDTICL
ncbi:hypothetical protein PISMIDRAFT_400049 [Pisolithus microcarpus 441]|uniref:Uncharacterized protein n=1 Tax=Pisolithus microcarpus 441 TaxID=765257 RepID=A0A0C9Z0M0_9AGAM|nr:hypothetical protein PISMIDRAFT_400049 [Pisolithus microcarpus 441]